MTTRALVAATLFTAIAASSCGGGGEGESPSRPTNPAVTVRFIGPDGTPYAPKEVILFHIGVGDLFPMKTWDDGVTTDLGVELVPGGTYDVRADGWGRRGVFADTVIRFTAPEEPVDLGTFDLRPLAISMTAPAPNTDLTSYPVEFTWSAYANSAATQQLMICAERLGNGCVNLRNFAGTTYSLSSAEKTDSIAGRAANWQLELKFTTAEGYQVSHYTQVVPFTFPD